MQEWIGEDVQTSYLHKTSHSMIEVILSLCFGKTSCIVFVYLMHTQFIVTFFFNYMIIIIYYFADIGTYVGDEPPQQGEEIDEAVK